MAMWKTVFIFNAGRNGWTETWYQERSAINEATVPAQNVANLRQALLGKYAVIEAIRIVSEEKPRVHVILTTDIAVGSGVSPADTAWNSVLARVTTESRQYQRNVTLRAVPDTWIDRDNLTGQFNPAGIAALNAAWSSLMASMRANAFRFKSRDKNGEGGTERDAVDFHKDVEGRIVFAVVGSPLGPGGKVTLSGVQGPGATQFAKGTHTVRVNAGGLMTLETKVPADVDPADWTNGKVRSSIPTYPLVSGGVILRPTKRSTGRAFFVTRGRR